jgi:small subunit ribosomal protein S6
MIRVLRCRLRLSDFKVALLLDPPVPILAPTEYETLNCIIMPGCRTAAPGAVPSVDARIAIRRSRLNEYELLYVVSPRLAADEIDTVVGGIQGLIESASGEVMMTDNWGRRRLAYPIKHHFEGTYVLKHLKLAPERIAEFESALNLNEDILRHLLTRGIIPDYQGPPDQELMEARRPSSPRRDAVVPDGDSNEASVEGSVEAAIVEAATAEDVDAQVQPADDSATTPTPVGEEAANSEESVEVDTADSPSPPAASTE